MLVKCFALYIYTSYHQYIIVSSIEERVVFALGHLCEAKLDSKSRKSLCSLIMVFVALDLCLVGMQRALLHMIVDDEQGTLFLSFF